MVGDCLDNFSKRLGREDKAQENYGVEMCAYKVGATQIKCILAPYRIVIQYLSIAGFSWQRIREPRLYP